jgi:hypothetical protein
MTYAALVAVALLIGVLLLRLMFMPCSPVVCGLIDAARQPERSAAVTKLAEGNAKERPKIQA